MLICLMITRCKFILRLCRSIRLVQTQAAVNLSIAKHDPQRWSQYGSCWWTDVHLVPGHRQPPWWHRAAGTNQWTLSHVWIWRQSVLHISISGPNGTKRIIVVRRQWSPNPESPIGSQLYTHAQDTSRAIIQGVTMLWIWRLKKVIQK